MTYLQQHARSIAEPAAFWAEQARSLAWYQAPANILESLPDGTHRWFADGRLNSAYLALDRQIEEGRGEQTALIYDSPVTGTQDRYSYLRLRDEVARLAGALRALGVGKGDRVIIYMPMVPQAAMAMLACARLGAVHSVVFGGFAPYELALRIDDATPKLVLTASCGLEFDRVIVYGPLMCGCTTVFYEGKPVRTPDAGAYWRVIEEHRVNSLFCAPTAIRAIRKEDPHGERVKRYDLGSLRHLFLAGEKLDSSTQHWLEEHTGRPVHDHWWQTETGWPVTAPCIGIAGHDLRAGSTNRAVPGYHVQVLDDEGRPLGANRQGAIVIALPLPPGCAQTLWGDHPRYLQAYLGNYPGYYHTGDGGYLDEDGFVYIMGRTDDVINVSGHRLSTGEMEERVAQHQAVAECAVIGVRDELKGHVPLGLVVLKDDAGIAAEQLQRELVALVREQIGALACFQRVVVVKRLPKTRSGKILRAVLRKIADGEDYAAPSTIDDPTILGEIETALRVRKAG